MIEQIKDYFNFDRSYASGLRLVMQFTPKMSLKKQLNVQPQSAYLHGVIHEELRQLAGYSFKDFELLMSQPVLEKQIPETPSGTYKANKKQAVQGDLPQNPSGQKKVSRKK